jgi:hypothetical protein
MKKLLVISASMLGLAAFASSAQAQIIVGVQFPAYYANPYSAMNNTLVQGYLANPKGYQGGVDEQQYWNVANNSTGGGDGAPTAPITNSNLLLQSNGTFSPASTTLVDSTGAASALTFTLSNATQNRGTSANTGNFPATQWYAANGNTDSYLISGVEASTSASTPVTLTLGGLNAGDSYSLIAYVGSLNYYGSQAADVTLGSTSYYLKTDGGSLSYYTQSTDTTDTNLPTADYVEFTGISGAALSSEALTVTGAGTGLGGFQLIDNGAAVVPEPSTWAMMLGGLGMLAFCVRRKAASVK